MQFGIWDLNIRMGHRWRQAICPRLGPEDHQDSPIRTIQWYRAALGVYWVDQRTSNCVSIALSARAVPNFLAARSIGLERAANGPKTARERLKDGYETA
jgi:hypothetical protein